MRGEIERSVGDKQIGSKDYDIDRKLSNPSHAKVKKTAKDQSSKAMCKYYFARYASRAFLLDIILVN